MRALLLAGLVAGALVGLGLVCGRGAPSTPVLIYPYNNGLGAYCTAPGNKDIRYVVDWGDSTVDTTAQSYSSGDTVTLYHVWRDTGTFAVRAMALLAEDPSRASDWSEPIMITVLPNSPPAAPHLVIPPGTRFRKGVYIRFVVTLSDPDGDSVAIRFAWGDDTVGDWTDFIPSGGTAVDSHRYDYSAPDTVLIKCKARDTKKAESEWADATLIFGEAGQVIWLWWDGEGEETAVISPVIAWDDDQELAYTSTDYGRIYGIQVSTGRTRKTGTPVCPLENNAFAGHPAYCAQPQHIIVGNEDGELYAFSLSLCKRWHWPGHTHEDSLTYIEWGASAVNGNRIYVPRENDSIYYFTDLTDSVRFENARYIPEIGEAPVIDISGNVIVGTGNGWLYKLGPDLGTVIWQAKLSTDDELYAPAIGSDGTVYIGAASGRFFAVGPDGDIKWTVSLQGAATWAVVSASVVFAATDAGMLYSLDPANGNINWSTQLSQEEILASPVLTANGLIYCQDWDDVLYCARQSDGSIVWTCNCPDYLPCKSKGGRYKLERSFPSLAITSKGNILVAGVDALYCVAGYEAGPLMTAPWPKWQRDHYNTGKAGGW